MKRNVKMYKQKNLLHAQLTFTLHPNNEEHICKVYPWEK